MLNQHDSVLLHPPLVVILKRDSPSRFFLPAGNRKRPLFNRQERKARKEGFFRILIDGHAYTVPTTKCAGLAAE
jgi:hypothetical protein